MSTWRHFILPLTLALLSGHGKTDEYSTKKNSMKFTVNNWTNKTTHCNYKMVLKHDGGTRENEGQWQVDMEQHYEKCDGSDETIIIASLIAPEPRPHPDYQLFPGLGYYRLHADLKPWDDARRACQLEGTHLAVLNSRQEVDALLSLWQLRPNVKNNYAFVGFHDLYQKGNFVTVFGETISSAGYAEWADHEPSGGEHCGSLLRSGKLNDMGCGTELPYFCEQSL